ncbi:MAG: S23 ribosomal protein [uncultured bacterium]|nr:MAG: S23 ribosomal protein [uncultured bacterium]
MKIVEFTDLIVWQKTHVLVLEIYKITRTFPPFERFGLASQMQRAVVSITSNLAEGFARRTKKEKLQFYYTALSSLSELRNQLLICRDLEYIDGQKFNSLEFRAIEVRKLLNGFIKTSENYSN